MAKQSDIAKNHEVKTKTKCKELGKNLRATGC